jgi:hypothetical protein
MLVRSHFLKEYSPDETVNIISTIMKGTKRVNKTNSSLASGDIYQIAKITSFDIFLTTLIYKVVLIFYKIYYLRRTMKS